MSIAELRRGKKHREWYLEDVVVCMFVREAMAAQRCGAVHAEVVLVVLAFPTVCGTGVEELR